MILHEKCLAILCRMTGESGLHGNSVIYNKKCHVASMFRPPSDDIMNKLAGSEMNDAFPDFNSPCLFSRQCHRDYHRCCEDQDGVPTPPNAVFYPEYDPYP